LTASARTIVALFALVAVAASLVLQVDRAGSSGETTSVARSSVLLIVRLQDGPMAAAVAAGGDRPGAAIALPSSVSLTIPGQGEATVAQAATLPGPEAIAAVSNLLGVWISHYAITEGARLAERIDREGGLSVSGERMSGGEVVAALGEPDAVAAWREILGALLRDTGPWRADDVSEADDAVTVERLLSSAGEAPVTTLSTIEVPGGLSRIDDAGAAATLRAFGREARPIPAIVLNGNGVPGVGQDAAALLIPAGFRIASSGNASSFDHPVTLVVANRAEDQPAAERARAALGLGSVSVAAVPSGLASVTIVLGRDFHEGSGGSAGG
jgi:hypothetical protein